MSQRNIWRTDLTYLKKVGEVRATLIKEEIKLKTYSDLLQFFPRKYIDRSQIGRVRDIRLDTAQVTLIGRITEIEQGKGADKSPGRLTATFSDGSGTVELMWFKGAKFVLETLKTDEQIVVHGNPRVFGKKIQIAHPEIERGKTREELEQHLKIIPVYHTTEKLTRNGLDSRGIRRLVEQLLEGHAHEIVETLTPHIRQRYGLPTRKEAFRQIHFPESFEALEQAQKRLKFEEFFFLQLLYAQRKLVEQPKHMSHPFPVVGPLFNAFYNEHIPFDLTGAQKRVIKEIRRDLARPFQMNRLVQGDVGSGKTMVAFMSMLLAIDNGFQSCLMAPTEILAEQHYNNIKRYSEGIGVRVALLTGSTKTADRRQLHLELRTGVIQILIGTHALIEDPVVFEKLGLVVVDEQHKFGVEQRARLWHKAGPGVFPHNMVMTATPIPRTLAMTVYGDLDVSQIDELPQGRKPIITAVRTEAQRLQVFGFMRKELEAARQIYVVYPLVEESEKLDYLAVTEGYEALSRTFNPPYRVGIVHGRMKPEAKEWEMQAFKRHQNHILVATTVIEVGVDVPNASVIVIENADKFGLSQLHQLRGRVGRGDQQSYCILMAGPKASVDAKKRLQAMVETTDGFKIAEIDMAIRGPGDFLGTRQSGLPELQLASFSEDKDIFEEAREAAFDIMQHDPQLQQPAHQGVKAYFEFYRRKYGLLKDIA
jgi:ATP-dependent DNA helicase RecG